MKGVRLRLCVSAVGTPRVTASLRFDCLMPGYSHVA
jgi:hypothetical protein